MKKRSENKERARCWEDRLRVLFALTEDKRVEKGRCLSAETLAAFIDGGLSSREREAVLTHLDACPACYHDWLAVSALRPPSRLRSLGRKLARAGSAWRNFFSKGPYAGLSLGTALTGLVLLLVWPLLTLGTVAERITQSYQAAVGQNIASLELPWEEPERSYGFGTSPRKTPAYRAFGAGMWSGRQTLLKKEPSVPPKFLFPDEGTAPKADGWSQTSWAGHYAMGRWCFLMQAVCQSETTMPYEFWKQQALLLKPLEEAFQEEAAPGGEDAGIVSKKMRNIQTVLEAMNKHPPTRFQRRKIASELYTLIGHLSPRIPPSELPDRGA